jgi:hypothetical protein
MHNKPHTAAALAKMSAARRGKPNLLKRKVPRVIDGVTLWLCPGCSRWLDAGRYYRKNRTPNGLTSQCRACHAEGNMRTRDPVTSCDANRAYMRRARARDPEKFRTRDRLASTKRTKDAHTIARQSVNNAVRSGRLIKPNACANCGLEKKLTGHHHDYSKPLDVEWLCHECHGLRHRRVTP